jgi:hypothetical protein
MGKKKKKVAFVTFSGKAFRAKQKFYRAFVAIVERECDYDVIHRWFESNELKTPQEIHEASLASIRAADVFIAEASSRSIGVGQQIAYAIQIKKPTILCLDASIGKDASSFFLRGTRSSNVLFIYYTDLTDLQEKLQKTVVSLDTAVFEKFNFLTNKRQKEFLLNESKLRNVSKSEFLRIIVDEWMEHSSHSKGPQ